MFRVSRALVYVVLSVASAKAHAETPTESATSEIRIPIEAARNDEVVLSKEAARSHEVVLSTEAARNHEVVLSTEAARNDEVVLSACGVLDLFKVYKLHSHDFATFLKDCNNEHNINVNLTSSNGTTALLNVYNAINREQCILTPEMKNRLLVCVNTVNGFVAPPLNITMAESHFGFNNTVSLRFRSQECINSGKVRKCVEEVFQKMKFTDEQLKCKTSIMRGFNITADQCSSTGGKPDPVVPGSGIKSLPSDILVLGTAIMLAKLTVFYLY